MNKKLSIIIPVYNEEKTIYYILNKIKEVTLINNIEKEIVIVNDNSKDNTETVLSKYKLENPNLNIQIFSHTKNTGKGGAIHTGMAHISGDYLIIQDADLEYDPREYNDLLRPIEEGFADVVFGSRLMSSKPHRALFFWHTIGNQFLTFLSNMMNNLNLTDINTCYKMFKSEFIKDLNLREKKFGFDPEILAKVAKIPKIRIYEVGISYYGRTYAEGKKINWRDGFESIYCIIKYSIFN